MVTYTPGASFADGSITRPINAAFLNGIETTLAQLAAFTTAATGSTKYLSGTGIDLTGATDSTTAVNTFLGNCSDGDTIVIPNAATIKLGGQLTISKTITLTGTGKLRWTAGITNTPAITVYGNRVVLDGIRMENIVAPAQSGDKQYGIYIAAMDVRVSGCVIDGFQQGIAVGADGEYYGTRVIGNAVLNVPGSGDGPASPSSNGEDRGDGIVIWGAEAIVVGNRVVAANGTDARVGIHCEGIPVYEGTPGPHSSSMVTIQGNEVSGKFRRCIVAEGVLAANITGNTVADATWWGIALIGGYASICSNNTIVWTRTSNDNQGSAWNPNRSAIMVYGAGASTIVQGNAVSIVTGSNLSFGVYAQTNGVGTRDDLTIANNTIVDGGNSMYAGVYINGGGGDARRTRVIGNTLAGHNVVGVYMYSAPDSEVIGNRITGLIGSSAATNPTVGVWFDGNSGGARVDGNTIYYSSTAIRLYNRNPVTTAINNLIYSANVGINTAGTASGILTTANQLVLVNSATKTTTD